jgi:hypothetical protein
MIKAENKREEGIVRGINDQALIEKKLKDYRKAVYQSRNQKGNIMRPSI